METTTSLFSNNLKSKINIKLSKKHSHSSKVLLIRTKIRFWDTMIWKHLIIQFLKILWAAKFKFQKSWTAMETLYLKQSINQTKWVLFNWDLKKEINCISAGRQADNMKSRISKVNRKVKRKLSKLGFVDHPIFLCSSSIGLTMISLTKNWLKIIQNFSLINLSLLICFSKEIWKKQSFIIKKLIS